MEFCGKPKRVIFLFLISTNPQLNHFGEGAFMSIIWVYGVPYNGYGMAPAQQN